MSLLVAFIHFYRRRLSGRGPLQRVVCTFQHAESCSAYGLRIAQHYGTWRALRLIRARLRRCSHAAVYRLPNGLGWGPLYDRPAAEIVDELANANEASASRAVVFASGNAVARARGGLPPFAFVPALGLHVDNQAAENAAARMVLRSAGDARPGSQSALIRVRRFTAGGLLAAASLWAAFAIHFALVLPLLFALVWRGRLALRQRNQRHRLRRQSRAYALAQVHRGEQRLVDSLVATLHHR